MTRACLRQLKSARITESAIRREFVLVIKDVGAKTYSRLGWHYTGVDDEASATGLLLNACQSSRLEELQLYGSTPMSVDFFESLALLAPTMFIKHFQLGKRGLADDVADARVLRALQSFAELKTIDFSHKIFGLQRCLLRNGFKAGVPLNRSLQFIGSYTDDVQDALLEFSFAACDEQYAERERSLKVERFGSRKNNFLQRWIEVNDVDLLVAKILCSFRGK